MFAQGGLDHKKRFCSFDIALRLFELSQNSKNESLQATCGMALSHLLSLLMSHGNEVSNSNATTPSNQKMTLNKNISTTNFNNTLSFVTTDPFQSNVIGTGAKFIAKVLEKGGLPIIMEGLRDGQPKLQQAYLNIINTIFSNPYENVQDDVSMGTNNSMTTPSTNKKKNGEIKTTDNSVISQAINSSLRSTRIYFLKSQTLIPILVKLVEQGGSTAVRGKALICIQLLCKQSPDLLASLSERRLPSIIFRILEPVLSHQQSPIGSFDIIFHYLINFFIHSNRKCFSL